MTYIPPKYLQIKTDGVLVGWGCLRGLVASGQLIWWQIQLFAQAAIYHKMSIIITSLILTNNSWLACDLWGVSSFYQIIHQCSTDLSTTCISISSLWLSIQQGCQGLVQAPEPHLKLGKPSRTALQGHELQQEEEHQNWLAVSEKVFSMPALSALNQDYFSFPPTAIT